MPKKATCCIPGDFYCAKGLIGCRGNHSSNGTQGKDPVACGCCVRQIAMTGILRFRRSFCSLSISFPHTALSPLRTVRLLLAYCFSSSWATFFCCPSLCIVCLVVATSRFPEPHALEPKARLSNLAGYPNKKKKTIK